MAHHRHEQPLNHVHGRKTTTATGAEVYRLPSHDFIGRRRLRRHSWLGVRVREPLGGSRLCLARRIHLPELAAVRQFHCLRNAQARKTSQALSLSLLARFAAPSSVYVPELTCKPELTRNYRPHYDQCRAHACFLPLLIPRTANNPAGQSSAAASKLAS